jgi:signal transduction histidine kinase
VVPTASPIRADLDPERLAQVVANLVENALKYADARVDVAVREAGADQIVGDDGPGIPPDELPFVFERLYTVRGTPGRAVGTGLGLAIVRELAAAMHGRAWVEATNGGARFVVAVPSNVPAHVH